jgi:hypothetical protein
MRGQVSKRCISALTLVSQDCVDEVGAPYLHFSVHPGKSQVMAKGVNAFGREGHTSRILLRYLDSASTV